ncbi:MAG TPA: lysine-sensitive aspartokinase 3 [Terriglobales bacterium]|jgi:aspartate kinase|nr:lysine-sensitive aspartokinase 3 [Terriglobales bacterium]
MIVMKFGGTSVEDEAAIERAAAIVFSRLEEKPVVVVSALAGVTDALLSMSRAAAAGQIREAVKQLRALRRRHFQVLEELASECPHEVRHEIQKLFAAVEDMLRGVAALGELTLRTTDNILCAGELLSSRMVSAAFVARGLAAELVDSRECIVTDASHTNAIPRFELTDERLRQLLQPLLDVDRVPVMAGFIAATSNGIATTLGRGGSDFSAAIVGAALNAKRIEIWTDVEGMMTTDPRLCPQARRIDVIRFDEAAEMAYFGAKVLHPATLIPAIRRNIPVYVMDSRRPESRGTCIRARAPRSRTTFRAIAAKSGMKVVSVRSARRLGVNGFLRAVFETFERYTCAADLVSTSEVSVSVALSGSAPLDAMIAELRKLGEVEVEDRKAIICLIGKDIRGRVGVAASVFQTLAAADINVHMISQGASEINIGFVIEESDVPEAVRQLHRRFFEQAKSERVTRLQIVPRGMRVAGRARVAMRREVG